MSQSVVADSILIDAHTHPDRRVIHMTARTQRIELITRGERGRGWSIEEKREVVAESLRPGVRPSEIIQRHGITS